MGCRQRQARALTLAAVVATACFLDSSTISSAQAIQNVVNLERKIIQPDGVVEDSNDTPYRHLSNIEPCEDSPEALYSGEIALSVRGRASKITDEEVRMLEELLTTSYDDVASRSCMGGMRRMTRLVFDRDSIPQVDTVRQFVMTIGIELYCKGCDEHAELLQAEHGDYRASGRALSSQAQTAVQQKQTQARRQTDRRMNRGATRQNSSRQRPLWGRQRDENGVRDPPAQLDCSCQAPRLSVFETAAKKLFQDYRSKSYIKSIYFVDTIAEATKADIGAESESLPSSAANTLPTLSSTSTLTMLDGSAIESKALLSSGLSTRANLIEFPVPGGGINAPTDAPAISMRRSRPSAAFSSPDDGRTRAPNPFSSPDDRPTRLPSRLPTPEQSNNPTNTATDIPTLQPTESPTVLDSATPTTSPTTLPTIQPTEQPSVTPTLSSIPTETNATETPTQAPSAAPTTAPSIVPSVTPTSTPTTGPTAAPSAMPTSVPTGAPSMVPTPDVSQSPTGTPTMPPTNSELPTASDATEMPTEAPTRSFAPTTAPSQAPSNTVSPTTSEPTLAPSSSPSVSTLPTMREATESPTITPTSTRNPTIQPTPVPSASLRPSDATASPTQSPSSLPSAVTLSPTNSFSPTQNPTPLASAAPTLAPVTSSPTASPTLAPVTLEPTLSPTLAPTTPPPTFVPTVSPTSNPTEGPTLLPSSFPTDTCSVAEGDDCCVSADCPSNEQVCFLRRCINQGRFRFTLSWTGDDDLDLYVQPPVGNLIFFGAPDDAVSGGMLESVPDQTAERDTYIQNTYFPEDSPMGTFFFFVAPFQIRGEEDQWTLTVTLDDTEILVTQGTGLSDTFQFVFFG